MVTTHLVTAQQFLEVSNSLERFELIEGELKRVMSPSPEHAFIVSNLARLLSSHALALRLGRVYAGDPFVLFGRNPDTVLGPDLAFVSVDRLPLDPGALMTIPPDLAVEVVSPGNSAGEMESKTGIYLAAGVKAVWIVYPKERRVVVHSPDASPQVFDDSDEITSDILPGLSFPVAELFDD